MKAGKIIRKVCAGVMASAMALTVMAYVPWESAEVEAYSTGIVGKTNKISMGGDHSAAITDDGSLYMWGRNNDGQLGDGTTASSYEPIKIMNNVVSVSLGTSSSAAICEDGSLWMWGRNNYGQLGNGTTEKSSIPIKIMDDVSTVVTSCTDSYHTAAIKNDGSLWMWGENYYGQLGNGTTDSSYEPIKIMDNVTQVAVGGNHSAAIKEDGSLWMWGNNYSGKLGDGTETNSSTPIKIMDDVSVVSLGYSHSAAIKEDGTLWMWGWNNYGQFGDGTKTTSKTPVQVTGIKDVVSVALGNSYSAIIKVDGKVYLTGYNSSGQLGIGTTISSKYFLPVKDMENIQTVSLGSSHSAVIKDDGTLWTWGAGSWGKLGVGDKSNNSRPVQVELPSDVMGVSLYIAETNAESANPKHQVVKAIYNDWTTMNIVKETRKIIYNPEETSLHKIVCTVAGDEENVAWYKLMCRNKQIAQSSSNTITVYNYNLIEGDDYYIDVVSKDGSSFKTKLMIEVEQTKFPNTFDFSMGGGDLFSFEIPEGIPLVGGESVGFAELDSPLYVSLSTDGSIRVGINIDEDEIKNEDNNILNDIQDFRKGLSTAKDGFKDYNLLKKYGYLPQKTELIPNVGCEVALIGYGEGKCHNGVAYVDLYLCGAISVEGTLHKQFFFTYIPVAFSVTVGGQAEIESSLNMIISEDGLDYKGEICLGLEVSLSVFGGVGLDGIVCAGVEGSGSFGMDFVLLSSYKEPGFETATIKAGLAAHAYLGDWETPDCDLIAGTWTYENSSNTWTFEPSSVFFGEDASALYDSSKYTLSDNEYETVFIESSPLYNAAMSNTIIDDIYISAEPKVISNGENTILVFLSINSERTKGNRTTLMYTVYNSETKSWSEPAQVDSNETMDWAPYLYELDGKIYVVYADANQTFGSDATIDDMAAGLDIAAAEFVDGKFVAAKVTSNEIYDSRPTVTVIDGVPTAVWVSNTDSDFFGQNSTNAVQYSQLIDGVWSSPVTAAEKLNCVTSVSAGTMGGAGYIAVTTDSDNDLSTAGDSVLTVYDFEGTAVEIAKGTAENPVFGTIPSVDGEVLVWYEDGNLAYRTAPDAETAYVFESAAVTSDYTIAGNKIMFVSSDSEGNSGIYTISYENGAWGNAVEAAEVSDSVTSYSATDDMVVFVDTHMEITDESITDTSALKYCLYNEKYDIEVHYADFDYEAITPSENLDVAIGITNGTQSTLTSVNVEIAAADGTKTTQTVECNLASGETGEITAQFTVPATIDDTIYTVTVTGAETDTNAENNSTSFNLGLTELSVTARETVVNNNSYFIAEIKNESYIETSGTVTISDTDGTVLYTETLDSIPANDTTNVIVKADELFGDDETETSKVVVVTVVSDKEEYYDSNNSVSEYAAIMDNRVPYVTVVFMDSEQNEISREVYDVGVTVTPPALPENTIGWVVYGDETETIVTDFSNIQKDVVYVAKAEEKLEVTAEAGENSVTLNWNEISTADSYKVMSYTDGEFKDIAETTETTYTVEALEAHKEYSFAVSFSSNGEWSECTEEDVVTVEVTEGLGFTTQPTDFTGKIGDTATFTVEATGENLTYQWEQDTGKGWTAINTTAGRKVTFSIGVTSARLKYKYRCVISDGTNSFTSNEVKMVAEEVFEITTQPTDFTGKIGDTAKFTIEASGANLTYQWEQDTGNGWTAINTTAGRKATFSIGVTSARLKYKYRCVVSNGTTSLTSDEVKMVVNEEFEITTQPTDFTGKIGDTAKFTVEASGANLTYQWEQDTGNGWTAINTTAGRKATFSIGVTAARLNYKYRCVVSNGTTSITSEEVKMVVEEEFEITTQPTDFTGKIGDTAKFTVEATGENLTYQWEQNTGNGWTAINTTAGRKATFSIGVTSARLNYKYRCVVSDGTNTIISDEVKMIVKEELEITTQPTDFTGKIGDTATFTVEATGENLTYQWEQDTGKGWTAINTSAGRSNTFSVAVAEFRLGYLYRCVVSDGTNSLTTDEVQMYIG